jgi:hypothetical protein
VKIRALCAQESVYVRFEKGRLRHICKPMSVPGVLATFEIYCEWYQIQVVREVLCLFQTGTFTTLGREGASRDEASGLSIRRTGTAGGG